jgi:hypothetical protein
MFHLKYIAPITSLMFSLASLALAEVSPQNHYNLRGQGGIRDTAAPEVWRNLVEGAPDLARQGSPKIMSNGPESRRRCMIPPSSSSKRINVTASTGIW